METGPQSDKNSTCVLVGFVTSVLQLLYQVTKLHKGITTKVVVHLQPLQISHICELSFHLSTLKGINRVHKFLF